MQKQQQQQHQKISKQFIPQKVYFDDDGTKHIVYPSFQKVITTQPLTEKTGQIQLKILFHKKKRISITEFGYSRFHTLSDSADYKEAKIEAFKSAYKLIPFSPDGFDIIGEKFIYIDSRNTPLYEDSQYAKIE
jgi:hypothetical protein